MTQKTVDTGFLSRVSMGLILVFITQLFYYTVILIETYSQKSKTRLHYLTFHNNDFAAMRDRYNVFRLSKNK